MQSKLPELKKGDKVFFYRRKDRSDTWEKTEHTGTVATVGRKYYTVDNDGACWLSGRYYKEDGYEVTDYRCYTRIIVDPQQIEDEQAHASQCKYIRDELSHYTDVLRNFTLPQLNQIVSLLKEFKNGQKDT